MAKAKRGRIGLVVLGSTGTIGRLTLEVAKRHPERIRVVGLSAHRHGSRLARQATEHHPEVVALRDGEPLRAFRSAVGAGWGGEIFTGPDALTKAATWPGAAVVVNGVVGAAGLPPSLATLASGRRLALANKESLVMAGELLIATRDAHGGELIPVDSEHSAIHQCLAGRAPGELERIVLTASGGPFRTLDAEALSKVTPEEALAHPTWNMGPRITVDSATMFNKGMELIEAHWLFGLPMERLAVWIHPESIVHGLIEMRDGSLLAQLSCPDMRLPIQLAISHPERWEPAVPRCDLTSLDPLTFHAPDVERFPCLTLARQAARAGGTAPAVLNAADEVLVAAFLAGRIAFPDIAMGLTAVLSDHTPTADPTLEEILSADATARSAAEQYTRHAGSPHPRRSG